MAHPAPPSPHVLRLTWARISTTPPCFIQAVCPETGVSAYHLGALDSQTPPVAVL